MYKMEPGGLIKFDMGHGHRRDRGQGLFLNSAIFLVTVTCDRSILKMRQGHF